MKRRNLIALVAVGLLASLALALAGVILGVTRTRWGQDVVRAQVAKWVAPLARGRPPYIGHIDLSSFLTRLTVDSIVIYDASGDVFFSCGRLEAGYDWRDLPDSRIALHTVNVEHPYLHLRQHANDTWNFSELFRSSPPSRGPKPAGFSWGDYIVLDSIGAHNATFILSMAWPRAEWESLSDSALRYELGRTDHIIRRVADGYERVRTWSNASIFVPYLRLADPDSDRRSGKVVEFTDFRVDESDPPFDIRHAAGMVRWLGDSLWIALSHWDLPASTGEAQGQLVWGDDKPMRYDVHIRGDSVALNDVNWVYPTLPRTGGGKTLLTIKNEPQDLAILDYRLDSMEMRSTKSHLTGTMTFGVGAPVLLVRNVNLTADPVDFDLLRTLAGKDFPIDWRGQIFGAARGPGGPVTDFLVDSLQGEWRDTHVAGAVSRFGGHGGLNILDPALTSFHDFHLTVGSLDLRSIEYLFPAFPHLKGTIAGVATLDSSWEDVRFHDADISHRDGVGDSSRFSGMGRITSATPWITFDVSVDANPISFDLLARTYLHWPLHGVLTGPIRVVGQAPDLDVKTTLQGTPGAFSWDGRLDLDSTSGYKANGQGELVDLDLQAILGAGEPVPGRVSGHYDIDLSDLFVATKFGGDAVVDLDPSIIDSTLVSRAHVNVRFADGRAHLVDGATAQGPAWTVMATGGFGLPDGKADSLHVALETDAITPWRPYLSRLPASVVDSLSVDSDSVDVTVLGRLDSTFDLHNGHAWAARVALGSDTAPQFSARNASATFAVEDVLGAPHGQFAFWADTLRAVTIDLDTLSGIWQFAQFADSTHNGFSFAVSHGSGLTAHASGTSVRAGAATTWRIDQGAFSPDSTDSWQLDSTPALIALRGASVDSMAFHLTNSKGGDITVVGSLPDSAPVSLHVATRGLPLHEAADALEHALPVAGDVDFSADIRGTRISPEIAYSAALTQPAYSDVHLAALTARGVYQNGRTIDTVSLFRDSTSAVTADVSIPVGLSLPFGVQLFRDSALSGHVQDGKVDLRLIEAFFPETKDTGSVTTQLLRLQGTWLQPRVVGDIAIHGARMQVAALGAVVFDPLNAAVRFTDNRIDIDSLHAHSGSGHGDHSGMLTGWIDMPAGREGWSQLISPSAFNLIFSATDFAIFNQGRLATVDVQTLAPAAQARPSLIMNGLPLTGLHPGTIQLQGPADSATVTGNLIVLKSDLYLQDSKIASKQTFASTDSTAASSGSSQPSWLNRLIEGLRLQNDTVTLGDNVRLKSLRDDPTQVDVKLAGTLSVRSVPAPASPSASDFGGQGFLQALALQGTLQALQGGQYTFSQLGLGRTFTVMSGSTITYDGTANNFLNPTLDIKAQFSVVQYGRPDITVIANVQGPARQQDSIRFTSPNAGAGVGEGDLISYLLIGQPGFNFGADPSAAAAAAALLGPSLSSAITNSLGQIGGGLSNVSFQGANPDVTKPLDVRNDPLRYVVAGRLNGEFQLESNVYFNIGSGLCVLAGAAQGQSLAGEFIQGLGAQLEYRFTPTTRVQGGVEPSTQAQLCSPSFTNLPGLAPTPPQFSLALSHIWRW